MTTKEKIQKVSVKGILLRDDKILFLQDEKGKWELPGGRVDFNESPEDTLKREFKEELNINNIKIGKIIHVWSFSSSTEIADYHFVILVYEVFTTEGEIKINDESFTFGWFNKKESLALEMRDGYKDTIKKYF